MEINWQLVVLLISFCIYSVDGQAEPQITKKILPEIRRIGETGRLECSVTRQLSNKVKWIHRGKFHDTMITSDDKVDLEDRFNPIVDGFPKYDIELDLRGDQRTYILIVRRLQLNDAGRYTCQVYIKGNTEHPSKDGDMVVMIPPTVLQSMTTQTMNVIEGSRANLSCYATGYPKPVIKWVRPNGKALPEPINTFSYTGNVLQLKDLKKGDRGVYRCIADNTVTPTGSHDATLYIDFKPFARPVQTSYGQAQNMLFEVTLECRVAGYPDPDLRWYKVVADGLEPIGDDDKHTIYVLVSHGQELSVSEFWYQLKIKNVQANDYGDYMCEGTNRLGFHRAKVQLYETSECQGPNCPPGDPKAAGSSHILPSICWIAAFTVFTFMLT